MKKQKDMEKKSEKLKWILMSVMAVFVAAGVVGIVDFVKESNAEPLLDYAMYEKFEEELQKRYFNYEPTEESYIPGYTWQELLDMGLVARDNDKNADSDLDGLSDYDELIVYHTNPAAFSTAGDMYSDKYKVENGLDVTEYKEGFVTPNVEEGLKVELEPADALNTRVYMSSYVWENDEEQNGYVAAITIGPYEGNMKYDLSEYGEGMTAGLVRYGGEFIKLDKFVEDNVLFCKYQGNTSATLLIYKKKNEKKVMKAVKNNEMLMPEAEEYTYFVSPQHLWNEEVGVLKGEALFFSYCEEACQHAYYNEEYIHEHKHFRGISKLTSFVPKEVQEHIDNKLIIFPLEGKEYNEEEEKYLKKYSVVPSGNVEEELTTDIINKRAKEEVYRHKLLAFKDADAFFNWVLGYDYEEGEVRNDIQCAYQQESFVVGKDTFVFPNFQSYIGAEGNCMGFARVIATLYNGNELYPYQRIYSGNVKCEYDLSNSVHKTLFDRYLDDYLHKNYFKKLGKKMLDASKLTTEENNFVNFIGMYWQEGNELFYLKKQYEIVREGQNPKADMLVALSEYLADGNIAVVCLLGESGGHAINAYEIQSCTYDPNKFFIYCYDANYVGKTTTIEVYVNEKTDTFSYVYEPSDNIRFSSETYSSTILKSGEKCNIISFCDENMNVLKRKHITKG